MPRAPASSASRRSPAHTALRWRSFTIVHPPTHVVASAASTASLIAPAGCDGCVAKIAPPTTDADPHSG